MRVLFDLNVVLDLVLNRSPWVDDARPLAARVLAGEIGGYVAAISVATLFYIARRSVGNDQALRAVDLCLRTFEVAAVGQATLQYAAGMAGTDFEDNVQVAAALEAGLDLIVTRDADFTNQTLPVLAPADLERQLQSP